MIEHLNMAITTIFVENILLAFFLGMCSFLAVSKKVDTAFGLGIAVIVVLGITCPVNWVINEYFLSEGALAWTGVEALATLDLSYLSFLSFIAVIAAMVQIVEMFIEKFSESLYNSLGIFLPLITVNCSILGTALFMVEREYDFAQSITFGLSSGVGWLLAILSLAAIRMKLRYSSPHMPKGLKGLGITMMTTGLMAMAFMAFAGINLGQFRSNMQERSDSKKLKIEESSSVNESVEEGKDGV